MKYQDRPTKMVRRPSLLLWFVISVGLFVTTHAFAVEYYVSPTGSDSNAGTLAAPWATIQKGANTAVAGDTVWIRGGTYAITTPNTSGSGITFSKSGTSDTNRIKYWAYPGEVPKIDFSNMTISTSGYTMGITVSGNWLHFKGIEECCTTETTFANNGWDANGSNDIFELLNMHNNMGNGIFMGTKSGGGNLILNCDGHDNYDPTTSQGQGQNADGFGVHYQTSGATTILRGNRSWWNSDDCYDLINQEVPVTVEGNWAFGCGFATFGTFRPAQGNGNGFKMGSSKTGVRHLVQNNVAWKNKASGFYANHSSGGNTWYNNTSFQNGTQYNMLASPPTDSSTIILTGTLVHIMRNNIGFPNNNANMTGVDTQFNTWDLGITPAAKDFLSITDPTVSGTGQAIETTSPALGPRQADGSLPNVDFMKLAAGSAMIDKGTDVKLPFVGTAPDLGAYEFGAVGVGGSTGAGGATGTAGTSGSGGALVVGGATGAGGRTGAGGSTAAATGGTVLIGGTPGSGGTILSASGGRTGVGGATVVAGTGGAVGNGGATVGTGGASVRTGGAVAVGGGVGTGGAVVAGAGGTSGAPTGTGGAVSEGGTTGSSTAQGTGSNPGCSCRLAQAQSTGHPGFALFALMLFALRLRKRR
jgi:MYXO-CTERM domain-containing protein